MVLVHISSKICIIEGLRYTCSTPVVGTQILIFWLYTPK
jgi:hypothetical protein